MSRISHAAVTTATAFAAVAVAASPASAWTGGAFSARLSSSAVIQLGMSPTTCYSFFLSGGITSSGILGIGSASLSGCTFAGSTVIVSVQDMPWSGHLSGGLAAITGIRLNIATCVYSGSLTGTYTGTDSPVTASFSSTLSKVLGPGSLPCPSTATLSATYVFTGSGL